MATKKQTKNYRAHLRNVAVPIELSERIASLSQGSGVTAQDITAHAITVGLQQMQAHRHPVFALVEERAKAKLK